VSSRVLSSAARPSTEEAASASFASRTLAIAGATAALGGSLVAWTLCEQQSESTQFQPMVTKEGLTDPMTSYQQHAVQVQQQEKEEVKEPTEEAVSSSVQATSPEIKKNIQTFPTELTEAEARLEASARKAKQHSGGIKIFSGNGNMSLALEIVRHLGISLGKATVGRFADGEVNVVINENVRGKDVYIVQPTCPPVNDNIMELLLMVSTLRRASARRITVVIPYYGYARQDRKMQVRGTLELMLTFCTGLDSHVTLVH
jgi:hypothetical protein